MRLFSALLLGCVMLAALRLAITAVAAVLIASLLWAAAYRPRQTAGFAIVCIVAKLADAYPVAVLALLTFVAIAALKQAKPPETDQPRDS